MSQTTLARAHGLYNLVGGIWPLVHMRSFEAVFGPKTDRWLVQSVAGLMVTTGATQLLASGDPEAQRQAKLIGIGTSTTLGTVDVIYAPTGRISKMYLLDAAFEAGWLWLWARSRAK